MHSRRGSRQIEDRPEPQDGEPDPAAAPHRAAAIVTEELRHLGPEFVPELRRIQQQSRAVATPEKLGDPRQYHARMSFKRATWTRLSSRAASADASARPYFVNA